MNKIVAKTISIALHPLVIPCLMMLVLFNSGTLVSMYTINLKLRLFLIIAACTFVMPLVISLVLYWLKAISSAQMVSHRERVIPFLFSLIFYGFSVFILMGSNGLFVIRFFMMAATIALFITIMVSYYWKISAHMVGIGGATGFIVALSVFLGADVKIFLLLAVLLSGAVGSSRLMLQEHSPLQIYSGYAVGFVAMLGVFVVGIY